MAKYQVVSSLTGHPESGAAHFDKNCSPCHDYLGHGHAVGPNLAEFAGKSTADFLLAILDPNAAINPNFLAYNIDTMVGILRHYQPSTPHPSTSLRLRMQAFPSFQV